MRRFKRKNTGFIIPLWETIFWLLSYISLFKYLQIFMKSKFKRFDMHIVVELWVLFNLLLSILIGVMLMEFDNYYFSMAALLYGLLRVFEVLVYQINVMLFDPYRAYMNRKVYKIKSSTRMVILLLHNYLELIFWYAVIYISIIILSNNSFDGNYLSYVKSSALCFVTFDSSINGLSKSLEIVS